MKAANKKSPKKAKIDIAAERIVTPRAPYKTKKHRELLASRITDSPISSSKKAPKKTVAEKFVKEAVRWVMVTKILDGMADEERADFLKALNKTYRVRTPKTTN